MFQSGQVWDVVVQAKAFTIVGNLGNTGVIATTRNQRRSVVKVSSKEIIFYYDAEDKTIHTAWPKANEVIEARPGFLKFLYADGGTEVSLALVT